MENTQQTIHFYQIDSIQFENKVHNKRINVCVCVRYRERVHSSAISKSFRYHFGHEIFAH